MVMPLMAGEPELQTTTLETNTWAEAVANFKAGMQQKTDPRNLYVTGGWGITTNGTLQIGSQSIYYHRSLQFKCQEKHVDDWPKVSTNVWGVQWRHEYAQETKIGTNSQTTTWIIYDYPHKKIVQVSKTEIKYVTTVETNAVTVRPPRHCIGCGREEEK
jgi:hypothetical protein